MTRRHYPSQPLVGVGGIIFKGGEVLLVKRGRPPGAGQWSLPGGLIEVGETINQALDREISEETGLSVDIGPLVEVYEWLDRDDQGAVAYHYVVLDYLCLWQGGRPQPDSDAAEARWFHLGDLARLGLKPET
ncbi:MAG: NUDIX hydrolase, partial [Deltaproteobacteria bacterium]|nr:NUDIX hydrolase [Deltaproteobacteria bacterium]